MNKLSIALLVAAIFAVNTQAYNNSWKKNDNNRHWRYESMKKNWTEAMARKDENTQLEMKKLMGELQDSHEKMLAERDKKHEIMNKLNRLAYNKTTKQILKEKKDKIKRDIKEKANKVKAKIHEKVERVKTDIAEMKYKKPTVMETGPVMAPVMEKPMMVERGPVMAPVMEKPMMVEKS